MAFLTYSKGPSTDTLNFLRASLARALNPVLGNQSGICRTTGGICQVLVGFCLGAGPLTYWNDIDEEFPRYHHGPYRM